MTTDEMIQELFSKDWQLLHEANGPRIKAHKVIIEGDLIRRYACIGEDEAEVAKIALHWERTNFRDVELISEGGPCPTVAELRQKHTWVETLLSGDVD